MRVLLIHQAFTSAQEPGGTRHFEIALHCIRQCHQFTIIAGDTSFFSGKRFDFATQFITQQVIDGVDIRRVRTISSLHRSFVWRVLSFMSFMLISVIAALRLPRPDIVLGTTPPIFQAVSAWLIALVWRKPFVLEVRDLWPEFAIDMGVMRNRVLIALSRWLERFLYRRARCIIINSPAYRDYLISRGVAPTKISFIPNGVDTAMFDQADGGGLRERFQLDGKFVVTYAGALGLANDIPTIISAAERLTSEPRIHFLLIGDGKERANLEALVAQRGLKNVTFTGVQPKLDMPNWLHISDVCVAALQNIKMFRMTYPNKVFDYMAARKPTVLLIDGVIREVVEAAEGGIFVTPGDAAGMAEAVLRLFRDPDGARAMGESARRYVQQHFERRYQAEAFITLLQSFEPNHA